MHQRDRSRPPGDPSLMRGGIDGYRIEMAKNEKVAAQLSAGSASQKQNTGNAARASMMHERETYIPTRRGGSHDASIGRIA